MTIQIWDNSGDEMLDELRPEDIADLNDYELGDFIRIKISDLKGLGYK